MKNKIFAILSVFAIFISNVESSEEISPKEEIVIFAKSVMSDDHFYPLSLMLNDLKKYDEEDLQRILKDFTTLYNTTFKFTSRKDRTFLVTAGGPTSGKSTLLEDRIDGQNLVYIDPDRTCLFHMQTTYNFDVAKQIAPTDAYNKWREASIFISNVFVAHALREGYFIAFGSTLTAPDHILHNLLGNIINQYGYQIILLHVTSPDDIRQKSEMARRERGIVQCTDEDLVNKGRAFFQKLPIYKSYAKKIEFYYREEVDGNSDILPQLKQMGF